MADEEEIDDDAVAAEWAAMAGGDLDDDDPLAAVADDIAADDGIEADDMGQNERVLDQTEIDSLLGFDGADDDGQSRSGIQALINSGLVAYERLPMLDIIFDRFVRMMSTSLRNFTSDTVTTRL